jgi:hypothetical protein
MVNIFLTCFNPKLQIQHFPASCKIGCHVMEYIYGSCYHHQRPEFLTNVKEDQALYSVLLFFVRV